MSASERTPFDRRWLEERLPPSAGSMPPVAPGGTLDALVMGQGTPGGIILKDHEIATAVNAVRRIALEFGGSAQLRERLAAYLVPVLRGEKKP